MINTNIELPEVGETVYIIGNNTLEDGKEPFYFYRYVRERSSPGYFLIQKALQFNLFKTEQEALVRVAELNKAFKEASKPKKWVPKEIELYWYVIPNRPGGTNWDNYTEKSSACIARIKSGNFFKNHYQAITAIDVYDNYRKKHIKLNEEAAVEYDKIRNENE